MPNVIVNGTTRTAIDHSEAFVTHNKADCHGPNCCIHNPSEHPLNQAPLSWRTDRWLMERICSHGVGHPDPDDAAYQASQAGNGGYEDFYAVHGCDGCCRQDRAVDDD